MTLDITACLRGPSRPKKAKKGHQASSRPLEVSPNTSTNAPENVKQATSEIRYVVKRFDASMPDELSVAPGDIVIFNYPEDSTGENWSYVTSCVSKTGFVPSDVLSTEPQKVLPFKKKLPRTMIQCQNHVKMHHMHSHHHHHPPMSEHHSTSGDIHSSRFHHNHHHAVHDIQPYTGDLGHLSPPTYYNVNVREPIYERYEYVYRRSMRENMGGFLVIHNFMAREENDLDLVQYESVTLLNKEDPDYWWVRRDRDGCEGFVPPTFLMDYEYYKNFINKGNSATVTMTMRSNDCHTYINSVPERESIHTDRQSSSNHPI